MQITNYRLKAGIFKPIRIAVVADLHNATTDCLISNIRNNHPDIIIIAGDLVYGRDLERDKDNFLFEPEKPMLLRFPYADDFIHKIPSIAPSFFAYGNHEWLLMQADIERMTPHPILYLRGYHFYSLDVEGAHTYKYFLDIERSQRL